MKLKNHPMQISVGMMPGKMVFFLKKINFFKITLDKIKKMWYLIIREI